MSHTATILITEGGDAASAQAGTRPLTRDTAEAGARAIVATLFLALAWQLWTDYAATGRVTGLLLLVSESLVVLLTIARRHARHVDRRPFTRIVAGLSLASPLLLRPAPVGAAVDERAATVVAAAGLLVVIAGKASLGRSFGLLPAHRGLVRAGLYRYVRHPIYLGYVLTHVAFLAAHPTLWNLLAVAAADLALLVRAELEERTLSSDPEWIRYRAAVRWKLLPRVY